MDLPDRVSVREVGPRDGFQNEPERIATDDKVRLIELLAASGVQRIELTSFVRADVIPQLADAVEVLERAQVPEGIARSVLVPNPRGLDSALEHRDRFDEVGVFLSASETHNRRNVNRSVDESLAQIAEMIPRIRDAGLRCEAVIATSFGCPYEGQVPPERTLDVAARLADLGADEVGFGDTTGMANPRQAADLFAAAVAATARRRADRALPQHPRTGPGQRAGRAGRGGAQLRVQLRRAGRVPGAAGLHRQRGHRGPGVDAARDGQWRPGLTSSACWTPPARPRRCWAGR